MTRTRRALRRALATVLAAAALIIPTAVLTASPAAAYSAYTQGHGYGVAPMPWNIEIVIYDGGPTKEMIAYSLMWRTSTSWPNPADYVRIVDNGGRQDAMSWWGGDRNHRYLYSDGICHPTIAGACTGPNWNPTLEEQFVYAWYGWFGTCPAMILSRTLDNSSILARLGQRNGSC